MPLNDEQKHKIINWFSDKGASAVCPIYAYQKWSIIDIVVAPKFAQGIVLGGDTVPMIQVVCNKCGFVRLHAAVPMGLLEEKPEKNTSDKKSRDNK